MAIVSLSPNSVLAAPIQVNPQIRVDLQHSLPQMAQDAQRTAQANRTDTITISPQALKMVDTRDASAKEAASEADEQRAFQMMSDRPAAEKNSPGRISISVYA
jgi:hypothetical protein